jgi:hypothetical protein
MATIQLTDYNIYPRLPLVYSRGGVGWRSTSPGACDFDAVRFAALVHHNLKVALFWQAASRRMQSRTGTNCQLRIQQRLESLKGPRKLHHNSLYNPQDHERFLITSLI